jgi:hypothetical protein
MTDQPGVIAPELDADYRSYRGAMSLPSTLVGASRRVAAVAQDHGHSPPPPPLSPTNAHAPDIDIEMGVAASTNNRTAAETDADEDAADAQPHLRRSHSSKLTAALRLSVRSMLSPVHNQSDGGRALAVQNPLFLGGGMMAAATGTDADTLAEGTLTVGAFSGAAGVPAPAAPASAHDSHCDDVSRASSLMSSPAVSARGPAPGAVAWRARKMAQAALPDSALGVIGRTRQISLEARAKALE